MAASNLRPAALFINYLYTMLIAQYTVVSRFATVRFTTIHFYDHCRVAPSTPHCGASLSQL